MRASGAQKLENVWFMAPFFLRRKNNWAFLLKSLAARSQLGYRAPRSGILLWLGGQYAPNGFTDAQKDIEDDLSLGSLFSVFKRLF